MRQADQLQARLLNETAIARESAAVHMFVSGLSSLGTALIDVKLVVEAKEVDSLYEDLARPGPSNVLFDV